MSQFQFRLDPLLRLRESVRDEKRSELAEAFRAEEALRQRIQELELELSQLKSVYRRCGLPGTVDVDRLIDAQRYELLMAAQRQSLAQHEQSLAQEIERRREALVAADREVRVLEKLRETKQQAHRLDQERLDVKRLDEVANRPRETEHA
jgi:flagellar export protein FliJ